MTHRLPRSQPFECPLASLGHNTPSLETSSLHHPLSSSPLNSRVYQRSRNSSILDINEEEILYHPASCQNSDIVCQVPSDIYHLPCGSSNHLEKSNELERTRKHLKYKTPPRRNFSTMNTCIPYEIGPNNSYLIEINSSNENFSKVTNNRSIQNELQIIDSHHSEQYFLQKGLNSLYIQDERKSLSSLSKRVHNQSDKYFNEARVNICNYGVSDLQHENVTSHMLHSPSSRSETSGSENIFTEEQNYRKSTFTKSKASHTQRGEIINNRFYRPDSQSLNESLANIGRFSPSLDQGYATLVSPSPSNHQIPARRRKMESHTSGIMFDKLPDDMVIQVFSWLDSYELCNVSKVCERFDALVWRTSLWRNILLRGEHINGDKALKTILMRLCDQKRNALFHNIEKIMLSDGCKITNRGLQLVAKCPELTHLQLHFSINTSNQALYDVLAKCTNLQHLDLTGCVQITSLGVNRSSESQKPLIIQYLDLTDCSSINDYGLKTIVQNCPQLVYLYLRRCIQITDAGLKFVPSFCTSLRELSVSDCTSITDFGLYELAKLGATLRYLSVAKCDQVSDAGLKVIARRCYKLRYLNTRGCEAVSDDSITVIARSCPRLRALDIGKCDVSDVGLRALAESCPNLKKISLKNCDMITDRGIHCIAYYCRGLQQLNIQDCQITIEGYRAVKKYCKRCIIEHTNPGFC